MMTEFKIGRPGDVYLGKKLYSFNERRVLVLSAGNDPRCWIKTKGKPFWHSSRKAMNDLMRRLPVTSEFPESIVDKEGARYVQANGQLVEPFGVYYSEKNDYELYRYQQHIPLDILERICRVSNRRWQVYNLLVRVPGAVDLFDSNPALAYMLASNWIFRDPAPRNHLRAARSLITKKQSRILEWLGFDGSKSTRNILRKIEPESLNIRQLLYLRNGLVNPDTRKFLSYVPVINNGVLRLATDSLFLPYLSPNLLKEIGKERASSFRREGAGYDQHRLLSDTLRMDMLLGTNRVPEKIQSLKQLNKLHDQFRKETYSIDLPEEFPAPPLPGTDSILPIQTTDELRKEADEQENCVASYARAIHAENVFIYRVLSPVRATLGIHKKRNTSKWFVFELTGHRNSFICNEKKDRIKRELFGVKSKNI